MKHLNELIADLTRRLGRYGYQPVTWKVGRDIPLTALAATPHSRPPRLFCAVANLPPEASDPAEAAAFLQRIRRALAKEHAGFPWPRRMGTYAVLLAGGGTGEALRGRAGIWADTSALHVNVLLGAVVIDTETWQVSSDSVHGIIETADQFPQIQAAAEQWCRDQRQRRGSYVSLGQALSVA